MEEDMLRISLENPTVESLTQALYKVIDAYKQLAEKHKKIGVFQNRRNLVDSLPGAELSQMPFK